MTSFTNALAVHIPARQRSVIDEKALNSLADSIEKNGLLHPIVLNVEGEFKTLVAGERRLRAVLKLHAEGRRFQHSGQFVGENLIPYTDISNYDEIALLQAELDENIMREQLSWQDEARALADIHKLRAAQNPQQTLKQTGEEIVERTHSSAAPSTVSAKISRALITSDFMDVPEVKNARNELEAFKAATRIIRAEWSEQLSEQTALSPHKLIEGDAIIELGKNENLFRCFIVDPPYGIDAGAFGNAAKSRHSYKDDRDCAVAFTTELLQQCYFNSVEDAHLWLFCDIDNFIYFRELCQNIGWKVFRTPIVWNSGTSGHIPDQNIAIRRNYELILFAHRGRGLNYLLDDVINGFTSRSTDFHAAQKPADLYSRLLYLSCSPGDHVCDPCCGSGTIFRAAQSRNMIATGIEVDSEYAKQCKAVIAELANTKDSEDEENG